MSLKHPAVVVAAVVAAFGTGCSKRPAPPARPVISIAPSPNVQQETQVALIKAKPGDTIEFGEGRFDFTQGLSLTVANVTLRGKGMDKTFLSFKNQNAGSEGLLVSRGGFLIQDLTVEDTKGDAVKVNDVDGVTFRRVRAQWTGGSKESNGAYGLYPVQCKNVLIEECAAIGASDAGIYVGQSQSIIVRKCLAERNVAGIEIENSLDADVCNNVAINNAGGLLVFDLPGLQVKNGKRVRVFENQVIGNNYPNFAPKGNMVADVAPGTGLMVLATDQVEVFRNTVQGNQTHGLAILSFRSTGRPIEDPEYDPIPEGIFVHDNTFVGNGTNPSGEKAKLLALLLGQPLPDIVYDGIRNPDKRVDGKFPASLGVYFKNNGNATFVNLNQQMLDPAKVDRDLKAYEGELPSLPPVTLRGVP
jgi:parallel beta-helix repeat protein